MANIQKIIFSFVIASALFSLASHTVSASSSGASLFLSPGQGTFGVGDTFSVSVVVNSGENFINAVEAHLQFPPDKIQVVSPSVGKSFISVWVGQPAYSNTAGTVTFLGTVPSPGIKVSQGILSTITFRVKSTGAAVIKFTDDSKILLNDGNGTNILREMSGGIYTLTVPAPAGPTITSSTHPDQTRWYPRAQAILLWGGDVQADGYSYILDTNPLGVPDDISEGPVTSVSYKDLSSGTHYFHVKALRQGIWGGVSHFILNVDAQAPAEFPIGVEPGALTTSHRPFITFSTTDADSGINHYEIKVVPLSQIDSAPRDLGQNFFIEAESPYVADLVPGSYQAIVRAYDNAGNFREETRRVTVIASALGFLTHFSDSTPWIYIILILLLLATAYVAYHFQKWHVAITHRTRTGVASDPAIAAKLEQLKAFQQKYGNLAVLLLVVVPLAFSLTFTVVHAAAPLVPSTPIVTTVPTGISNNEVFYVGGKNNVIGETVRVYLQNQDSGETQAFDVVTDEKGDWFYVHKSFLPVGNYRLWAQTITKDVQSPPSPEYSFPVTRTAIRLGASRISFETLYLIFMLLFLGLSAFFGISAGYHYYHGRKKHKKFMEEILAAENSVKRGFALLRRDLAAELENLKKARLSGMVSAEHERRKELLENDLSALEAQLGKEIWTMRESA